MSKVIYGYAQPKKQGCLRPHIPVEVVVLLPLYRTSYTLALKPRPISLGGRGAMRRGTSGGVAACDVAEGGEVTR